MRIGDEVTQEQPSGRFDRRRIGLLVPSTNVVMERDFWRMAPDGVSIVTARMTYDRSLGPLARLEHQLEFVPQALRDLTTADVDVVVYGCTSGSFVHGPVWEDLYIAELESIAGRPVVLTARALVEAALAANITRPALVTPYRREINDRFVAYIEEWGCVVAAVIELDGSPPERIPVSEIVGAVQGAPPQGTDGFVIACTALRGWEAALAARDLTLPVITSNQAAFRTALWRADVRAGHA
jgi:maleate cis-trans isomerase